MVANTIQEHRWFFNYKIKRRGLKFYPLICTKPHKIRYNTKIRLDGHCYYLGAKSVKKIELYNAIPIYLSDEQSIYCKKLEKAILRDYYEEKDKNGNLILSEERNSKLWDVFIKKLESDTYKNKKTTILQNLKDKKEKFTDLSMDKQCEVLLNIVKWFGISKNKGANLTEIGEPEKAGVCTMNKDISRAKEAVLILESTTGLHTREIDLLSL